MSREVGGFRRRIVLANVGFSSKFCNPPDISTDGAFSDLIQLYFRFEVCTVYLWNFLG